MGQQVGGDTVIGIFDTSTNSLVGVSVLSMDYGSTSLGVGINALPIGRFNITLAYLTA